MNDEPKQIIVVRKDLNMNVGKIISQAAHASMAALLSCGSISYSSDGLGGNRYPISYDIDLKYSALQKWLEGSFTKICVSVNSEQELLDIYNQALNAGLICSLIEDAGRTVFNGVPTKTCCAIGPAYPEQVNPITGHLLLY